MVTVPLVLVPAEPWVLNVQSRISPTCTDTPFPGRTRTTAVSAHGTAITASVLTTPAAPSKSLSRHPKSPTSPPTPVSKDLVRVALLICASSRVVMGSARSPLASATKPATLLKPPPRPLSRLVQPAAGKPLSMRSFVALHARMDIARLRLALQRRQFQLAEVVRLFMLTLLCGRTRIPK